MREGLILADLKGNILYANTALEELLYFSNEEIIENPCNVLECDNCFNHTIPKNGKHCALFFKGDLRNQHCSFKLGIIITTISSLFIIQDILDSSITYFSYKNRFKQRSDYLHLLF